MNNLEKALAHLTKYVKQYREMEVLEGNELNVILQQLTGTLFFLEKERSKYHEQWQKTVFNLVKSGATVARAENEAHVITPELYLLRHIMESGYTAVDAIRSNLSWLKTEKFNAEKQ